MLSSAELSSTQPRQTPTLDSLATRYPPVNVSGGSVPEADRRRGRSEEMDSGNAGGDHKVTETGQKEAEGSGRQLWR